MMAFQLSNGVVSETEKIFMMDEEEVYMMAYLKRIDAINSELAQL